MELVAVVILLALLQFVVFAFLVGGARGRYQIEAPATTGHPVFERYFRVQQNTLEQLVVLVPSMWLFGLYVSPIWAAGLGAIYLVGRIVYLQSYVKDPKKRSAGFGLSFLPIVVLTLGALWAAGSRYFGN
jgi:uncharacterized membrane protein YecN with MAPEG domain